MNAMIEFNEVSFAYESDVPVLKEISFSAQAGEAIGLVGANGAGKSTLMKILLGLLPYKGSVKVDGLTVEKKSLAEIRRKTGFVLQNSDNQMFMPTVLDDVMFGLLNYGMSREEAERKTDEILERLGIAALKHKYNHKISGGEKRMAAVATVLAMEPSVIVMDEPTTALDPCNRRTVINCMKGLTQTKLIASHDLDMILDTCSRVLLIADGRLAADGPAEQILRDADLLEANRLELPLRFQK